MAGEPAKRVARFLIGLLRFQMATALAMGIFFVMYPQVQGYWRFTVISNLIWASQLCWLASAPVLIVVWPIWFYNLYRALTARLPGYPIPAWRTLLWYVIPWYSVWGMLSHMKTLTDRLFADANREFVPQRVLPVDPRYIAWAVVTSQSHCRRAAAPVLPCRLLRSMLILFGIWFITLNLAFGGSELR